ncbi:hypothetical protein [Nocardia sp. NPDC057668]|uniref:hypothetical protein n=1 Tax=Nocardia sp. NPDC057668 TaxID=3346202 RepID=UPI0036703CDC
MSTIAHYRSDATRVTRDALRGRLARYLPDPTYRQFYSWALSARNPRGAVFDRIIGMTQLGNLTAAMFVGLEGAHDWDALVRLATPVNLYQIFEVVSDNLGIGQAAPESEGTSCLRKLLREFNTIAMADLRKPTSVPAAVLLADVRTLCDQISAFDQSLAPSAHARVVGDFCTATGRHSARRALERSVWSGLVANLEASRDVLTAIAGTRGEQLVRERTLCRYEAVEQINDGISATRPERTRLGANAILVTPTLGYFGAVFGEMGDLDREYVEAIEDGSLVDAFDSAALLVRLQNDIGTPLLLMSPDRRLALFAKLRARHADECPDVAALVRAAADDPAFNRFRKDLLNGEFNLCLHDLERRGGLDDGLCALLDDLDYYGDLYAMQHRRLEHQLTMLARRLRDRRIIELTRRFVVFHEELYRHRYDSLAGDYAI